jgi:hypothetical protein
MATDHERSGESSLLESVARGFVYMAALNSSVGPAVDAVAGAFGAGVDPITVATPGTVVSLLIAAVLVYYRTEAVIHFTGGGPGGEYQPFCPIV